MQKIYIVTGANGFLGNNIVRQLIKKEPEAEIRALVSSLDRTNALKISNVRFLLAILQNQRA